MNHALPGFSTPSRPAATQVAIRGSVRAFLATGRWLLASCALVHAQPLPAAPKGTVVATRNAPAATAKPRVLHEDRDFRMVAVGHGSDGTPQTPGFHVFDKKSQTWIRIESVSLKGAVLGRSPTFEECRALGKNPPAVCWDFRPLAGQDHVDFPLRANRCLFFPDRIERDDSGDRMILSFNSGWKLPFVRTVLVFSLADLRRCFESK